MTTPVPKIRPRLLLLLATTLLCGAFTACDDDYHPRRTSHGYHDNDRRHHDDRHDGDRHHSDRGDYRRDTRSTYYGGGAGATSVTVRRDAPVERRSVTYQRY